jgi:pimeloyl-ACP methyl ester carboxylesterase
LNATARGNPDDPAQSPDRADAVRGRGWCSVLQQNIPNAQLIVFPDASHGALYQYPERFVRHVSMFLCE